MNEIYYAIIAVSVIGVICIHVALDNISKFLKEGLLKDRFNFENESFEQCTELRENKYSVNGYIKLWVQGSENERNLNVVREIIANPQRLREAFERIINEELRIKS